MRSIGAVCVVCVVAAFSAASAGAAPAARCALTPNDSGGPDRSAGAVARQDRDRARADRRRPVAVVRADRRRARVVLAVEREGRLYGGGKRSGPHQPLRPVPLRGADAEARTAAAPHTSISRSRRPASSRCSPSTSREAQGGGAYGSCSGPRAFSSNRHEPRPRISRVSFGYASSYDATPRHARGIWAGRRTLERD